MTNCQHCQQEFEDEDMSPYQLGRSVYMLCSETCRFLKKEDLIKRGVIKQVEILGNQQVRGQ